ncbi:MULTISPECIES: RIP metalloprotease RseP [Paenibacillus]|uniref:Zinc metalloprotease n=1 Tax=Paenibacillus naphthalenovorans TaxID=162209 RepID=A0A0U2U634_9BACL|nr:MULTISPECIES: RIP metalloprotease RseP [Paenibacillus]ALS21672.1 RIP metalloprotease RseP [Paenibacillus naphthalenovorans]NTZ18174.1 RIP metalloprotease RseP [Paenibacillus sp. JMULE4]GCL71400.1 RIP metalloprotease RseP [Paenibacillus naphthalenovorans]SDI88271.1 regulator of sigma E protease [Paenibacillus naphthalenovorans]
MATLQNIFQIVLLFFVLVSIHEWGHFYFAKRAGILVREFAIGFGPKLLSFKQDETRYTLRLLPIGGFVRMAGEDPEIVQINPGQRIAVKLTDDQVTHIYLNDFDSRTGSLEGVVEQIDLEKKLFVRLDVDGDIQRFSVHPKAMMISKDKEIQIAPWDRQFGSKTVGQRALSIFAGPLMNFILAFILFVTVVFIAGVPHKVKIAGTVPGSAAQLAGLQSGDLILNVNGVDIGADRNKLTSLIQSSVNKPMDWTIERNGEIIRKNVTPAVDQDGVIRVGVTLVAETRPATVMEGLKSGWNSLSSATMLILDGFGKLATLQFKLDDLGGPVRIVEFTSEQASAGWAQYISWTAIMSLYLGLFNLLPIPALDGSRLVFLGLEAVRGKPVDPSRESMVHFVGFAMLMLLMIAVTYNDILRLMNG